MTAIPVNLVTGFLGSGKTTLLQRLLPSQELAGAAVLVNELGEVGLDHHLLRRVEEDIVLLKSGCLCCTIRGDLRDSVRDLYDRRECGTVPPFDRLIIETTGLADPAPIVATFTADPVLCHHFRLGNIITVVDARNGRSSLAAFEECRKQAAVADRIVISKTDITPEDEIELLRAELLHINRTAVQFDSASEPLSPSVLMANDICDPAAKAGEVRAWLADENMLGNDDDRDHAVNRHGADIVAFCVSLDTPLDWTAFALWLTMLLNRHGQDILRVKGMLHIQGVGTPVIVHGVQHTIHPPTHLDAWPDGVARTSLIFIAKGLVRPRLQESLEAFNRLAAVR
jgi:G3E family GTPase